MTAKVVGKIEKGGRIEYVVFDAMAG